MSTYKREICVGGIMKIENIGKARELMDDRADLRRVRKSVVEQSSMNINGYTVSSKYLEDAKKEAIKYLDKKIKQIENQLKEL